LSHRDTFRSTMTYAVSIAGSEQRLAERLSVRPPTLVNWLAGIEPIPNDVFLLAVDIVLNATAEEISRSRDLLRKLTSTT
jgi:DNA-binding transcriptional regulator YdaS (Cro superfamily)